MADEGKVKFNPGRHILALLLFPIAGLLTAVIWLWIGTHIAGVGQQGYGHAAAVVVMPIWALAFGIVVWLPGWLLHNRKWGAMRPQRAALYGGLGGFIFSLIFLGPSGLSTRGGAMLMGYAIIAMLAIGAWAHNAIMRRNT